jgi:hypothetical protein
MNTDFRILWIDDIRNWYIITKPDVERILTKLSFVPKIEWLNGANINSKKLFSNKYELILIDYELIDPHDGIEFIKQIRDNKILSDILFYSGKYNVMIKDIKKRKELLQGVYFANRDGDEFIKTTKQLISKIVSRSLDPSNLRGVVMSSCSTFESQIQKFLLSLSDFGKNELTKKFAKAIAEQTTSAEELKRLLDQGSLNELIISQNINNYRKCIALNKLINTKFASTNPKFHDVANHIHDHLFSYRNALAHQPDDKPITVTQMNGSKKEIRLTKTKHIQLRKTINKYNKLFAELEIILNNFDTA